MLKKKIFKVNFHLSFFIFLGIGPVLDRALKFLDPENKGLPIMCSLDIDGCDPSIAPGTGTKAHGGLSYSVK